MSGLKSDNMEIIAFVERNDNNYYQISTESELFGCGFGGYGYSVEEAKEDFLKSIEEAKEMAVEDGNNIEGIKFNIVYKYDIQSFFAYFDFINVSQFAKKAGINESKMRQYKTGLAFASEKTTNKILKAIHTIGEELTAAKL